MKEEIRSPERRKRILYRYAERSAFSTSLNGIDLVEIFFQKTTSQTASVSSIAAVDGRAGERSSRCVAAIIVVVNKSL